jgi:hypothetical protein
LRAGGVGSSGRAARNIVELGQGQLDRQSAQAASGDGQANDRGRDAA